MIAIKQTSILDERENILPMLYAHYKEIYNDDLCDPLWELYEHGNYKFLLACDDDKVVGYCGCFIMPHHHAKSKIIAICDGFYVLPEIRKSGIGYMLLSSLMEIAKQEKCTTFQISLPASFSDKIISGLEMKKLETVFTKQII